MPRVLCTIPNAAEEISGVRFTATDSGMLSEPLDEAMAQRLSSISGYQLVPERPPEPVPEPRGAPAAVPGASKAKAAA